MGKKFKAWASIIRRLATARVPLPGKVLASYLVVVLAGALPSYFFLQQLFLVEFANATAQQVASHALLLANFISDRDDVRERVAELESIRAIFSERVTYISGTGRVLFDSLAEESHNLGNHLEHPELARARGIQPPDEDFHVDIPNIGIARRMSETSHVDTLFVAIRVVNAAGSGEDFLRLSVPTLQLQDFSNTFVRVFRNSQAAAISMAIVLSLLAAIFFMRPLQQLRHAAKALASGDYTVRVAHLGHDEIGDVGRALTKLAEDLRQRLAVAQAGEAMVVQLIQGMHLPMAVMAPDGRIVAINGATRDAFSSQQARGEVAFVEFTQSAAFADAKTAADTLSEPIHVSHNVANAGQISGWVHILRHPTMPPFVAFLGEEAVRRPRLRLPKTHEMRPTLLATAFAHAQGQAATTLAQCKISAWVDGLVPEATLCNAFGRLELTLLVALCGINAAPQSQIAITFVDKPTRIGLMINAPLMDPAVETLVYLLAPIGGRIKATQKHCMLLLARA